MKWQKLDAHGTHVMKVWEVEGAEVWPQVSILRVSNDSYVKFFQNPRGFMEFVNAKKFFSQPVIIPGPWVSLSSVDKELDPVNWVLTLVHKKSSTMYVAAVPLLRPKPVRSKKR